MSLLAKVYLRSLGRLLLVEAFAGHGVKNIIFRLHEDFPMYFSYWTCILKYSFCDFNCIDRVHVMPECSNGRLTAWTRIMERIHRPTDSGYIFG